MKVMNMKRPSSTRQVDIKPEFRSISEVKRHKSFAFYGRSGSGKTTLSCTFPTPILLLDINDEGTDSVSDMKDADLKVWDIEEPEDFEDAYWWLSKNHKQFKTVVIDTVTMLTTKKIEEVAGIDKLEKSSKVAGDWGTMSQRQWGKVAAWMKIWITRYRNLPVNIVFLAQERSFNVTGDDEDAAGLLDPEIGPALSPAVKSHLNAAVTMIANTYVRVRRVKKKDEKGRLKTEKKIEYVLGVGPSDIYARKVRKPRSIELPDVLVDPTYEDLIAIIEGEK